MLKIIYLFFLILVTVSTLAQPGIDAGIFYTIDDINNGKIKFSTPVLQCLTEPQLIEFQVSAEDLKYRQQCARALCGSPSIVPSVYVDKKNISSYMTSSTKYKIDKIKPKLKAALESIRDQKKKTLADAEAKLLTNDKLNFNPRSWENTDTLLDINVRTFEKYLTINIDKNAPLGKKISYKITDPSSVPLEIREGLVEYKEQLETFKNSNPDTLVSLNLLSKNDFKDFLKVQISRYESVMSAEKDSALKNRNNYNLGIRGIKNLKKLLNTPVNNVRESLIEAMADLYDTEALVFEINPDFIGGSSQKACLTNGCQNAYQAYFKSINARNIIADYKKGLDDPKAMERSMSRCIAGMVAAESLLASQSKALTLYAETVPKVLTNVIGKFSDHTQKYYANYFKNDLDISAEAMTEKEVDGVRPPPLDQYEKAFDSIIQDPIKYSFDEAVTLKEIIRHAEGETPNPLASSQFCNSDPAGNAWDSYLSIDRATAILKAQEGASFRLPKKDTLYVSPFSCNHQSAGASVIAHELGHAINQGFLQKKASSHSTQIYMKLRKCVSSNYAKTQKPIEDSEFSFPGDYIKTEEDTADLIAFMAGDKTVTQTPFACSLLKQDDSLTKFLDLYIHEDAESNHSPSFYRLLLEVINKNIPIPTSCQIVIDKSKELTGFQKCLE